MKCPISVRGRTSVRVAVPGLLLALAAAAVLAQFGSGGADSGVSGSADGTVNGSAGGTVNGSANGSTGGREVSEREPFVGVYTLAEFRGHGTQPTGRIAYDEAGRMWAMLLPPGREPLTAASTSDDYRTVMRGVVAYYGTYEVDETAGRVVHHVESASNPAWIGDEFVRWYRFEDGDLRLSLNPEFDNPLLWRRLPR